MYFIFIHVKQYLAFFFSLTSLTVLVFTFVAGICGKNAERLKEAEMVLIYFLSVV